MTVSVHELIVNHLEHLSVRRASEVDQLVRYYNPQKIIPSPINMKLILTDEMPIFHRPQRSSYEDQNVVEKQIKEWVADGSIHHSTGKCTLIKFSNVIIRLLLEAPTENPIKY